MSVGRSLNPDHQMKPSQHVRKRKLTAPEQREREPVAFLPLLARRHRFKPLARLSRNLNKSGILIGNKFTSPPSCFSEYSQVVLSFLRILCPVRNQAPSHGDDLSLALFHDNGDGLPGGNVVAGLDVGFDHMSL